MCKNNCKVVFLDRDGTMNVEVNYLHRKEDLKLIDGTAEAVRLLNEAGYKVIVITNQAGVARGYYTEADVKILHDYMNEVLGRDGAHVDAFYYCPHHPEHGTDTALRDLLEGLADKVKDIDTESLMQYAGILSEGTKGLGEGGILQGLLNSRKA